jgi:hypothetical protein
VLSSHWKKNGIKGTTAVELTQGYSCSVTDEIILIEWQLSGYDIDEVVQMQWFRRNVTNTMILTKYYESGDTEATILM